MAQSLSNVLVHFVFSTKDRLPLIQNDVEENLYRYINGICSNLKCPLHQIGGIEDHIHILLSLSRNISISDLIGDIKASSSQWIKKQGNNYRHFAWQGGYGAFSIGKSGFYNAVQYITNQKEHHKKQSFQDEYLTLLKKYDVGFDERYLWE